MRKIMFIFFLFSNGLTFGQHTLKTKISKLKFRASLFYVYDRYPSERGRPASNALPHELGINNLAINGYNCGGALVFMAIKRYQPAWL
jgi:hypothetical protein